ncbi:hypothetical protein S7335_5301 [Synechococcus sp. PCC 7335]|nr:hypothetical protein S7335_5301 [Synechococcus sp. PCC 7335]
MATASVNPLNATVEYLRLEAIAARSYDFFLSAFVSSSLPD